MAMANALRCRRKRRVDEERSDSRQSSEIQRCTDTQQGEARLLLSAAHVEQGKTVRVLVTLPRPGNAFSRARRLLSRRHMRPLMLSWLGQSVPAMPAHDCTCQCCWIALLPTTPLDQPGTRSISLHHTRAETEIELLQREFGCEWLDLADAGVTPSPEERLYLSHAERTALGKALAHSAKQTSPNCTGVFTEPHAGVISSPYGTLRYFNGRFAGHDAFHKVRRSFEQSFLACKHNGWWRDLVWTMQCLILAGSGFLR